MTAGYWIFIRTMTIFNPPSNWPPRPIVCMTIFIEWSRSDSDIPLLSPVCRLGWQAAAVSRDYHGALSRSGPGQQHEHITSHPEQRSRIRPEPVGAPWLPRQRSCPAHDTDHGFSDWRRYFVLRRWIMSNLVSFTFELLTEKIRELTCSHTTLTF